jgi:hypothetical protein
MHFWNLERLMAYSIDWYPHDGVESADHVWLTCCALHNMLLEVDGLDTN